MREPRHAGPLCAIVWDFDGTLADTRHKNLAINRRIVEDTTGRPWQRFAALATIEAYDAAVRRAANWRELYRRNFSFSDADCERAADVWAERQLADATPVPIFEGLPEVLARLGSFRQGIVSQNARAHMIRLLDEAGIGRHFGSIVGYQEVPLGRQKPDPDGLLACLEELTGWAAGRVLSIGDHEGDVRCAIAANRVLAERGVDQTIVSVGALYADGADDHDWQVRPDHGARTPQDILAIVRHLEAS